MPKVPKKFKRYKIAFYIIVSGIALVGFNLFDQHERYFTDELASEIPIKIYTRPQYVSRGKGSTSRYQFFTYEYSIAFWVSDGALGIINDHPQIKKSVESIGINDTLILVVRDNDLHLLKNKRGKIRVMGIHYKGKDILNAGDVRIQDQENLNLNSLIGFTALCIGAVILTYQITNRPRLD